MHDIYLGLGSNIGRRRNNLKKALTWLVKSNFQIIQVSGIIETKPYGPVKQGLFLNMAVYGKTTFSPFDFLEKIHWIEEKMGRKKTARWGPRNIDIDILFFDNVVLSAPDLTIPHPDIECRDFVLRPLLEINPNLIHPVLNKTIQTLWEDYLKNECES